jgi:hypothetical protein
VALLDDHYEQRFLAACNAALRGGVKIEILLLDPDCRAAEQRAEELRDSTTRIRELIRENLLALHRFRSGLSEDLRLRLPIAIVRDGEQRATRAELRDGTMYLAHHTLIDHALAVGGVERVRVDLRHAEPWIGTRGLALCEEHAVHDFFEQKYGPSQRRTVLRVVAADPS